MSFAENLKAARKEKNVSQEALAELLNVSRQAVSKWEQGIGFPEVENLLILSDALGVSLDYLLRGGDNAAATPTGTPTAPAVSAQPGPTGKITIKAQDGKGIYTCYKFGAHRVSKMKDAPKYALMGVDGKTLLDENRVFLGWYADEDAIKKEMDAIMAAMERGRPSYELRYTARVKNSFWSVKLDE